MASSAPQETHRSWLSIAKPALVDVLTRPLTLGRFLAATAFLVAVFTVYCAIYCRIAFYFTHGAQMPLNWSAAWAFSNVVPWAVCFELCKRARRLPPRQEVAAIAGSFVIAGVIAIPLGLGFAQLLGGSAPLNLSMELAHLLPGAGLTAILIAVSRSIPVARNERVSDIGVGSELDALLQATAKIEWIRAAGNYVEVRQDDRTRLHRVTMQRLEEALSPSQFVRIHRQVIVNTEFVEARLGSGSSSAIRLRDGTVFKIGGRYERNWKAVEGFPNSSVRH